MNVIRYAEWMQERGHQVTIFTVDNSPLAELAQKKKLERVYVSHHHKYIYFLSAIRVEKTMREMGVDLIWIRDTRDMGLAGRIGKRLHIPVLYQQAMQLGVDKLDIFHTRRFNRISAWVATLDFLYQQVLKRTKFSEEKLHMIPLGLDMSQFNNQISKEEARKKLKLPLDVPIVGIVGRIDPLKGQDTLLKAMSYSKNMDWHVIIVGEMTRNEDQFFVKRLKNIIELNYLEGRVHFIPFLSEVELAYAAMDIFAMCSAGETFGMVTIEAMAAGVPVLGTDAAGTPEILNHGEFGEMYDPFDHHGLGRIIVQYLEKPEDIKSMGLKGRARAQKLYEKNVVLDQLESLALDLVASFSKSGK